MKKFILLFVVSLICIVSIQRISYAFLTSKDIKVNEFNLGSININIEENFKEPTNWHGTTHTKKVQIKNIGKSQALIRVCIIPRWVDEKENPWAGDTSGVTLNYINTIDKNEIGENKWVYGNDNYYYYNSVVEKNSKTSELLESVSVEIDENLKERYKDKKLVIDVKAEAIQATKDAYKASWTGIEDNQDITDMLDKLCVR